MMIRTVSLAAIFGLGLSGGAFAVPARPVPALQCPATMSTATAIPRGAILVGTRKKQALPIRHAGLVIGDLNDPRARQFEEEMIDEWEDVGPNASQAVVDYDKNRDKMTLKCRYAPTERQSTDRNAASVLLLIPIRDGTGLFCQFMRRNKAPLYSAKCSVK